MPGAAIRFVLSDIFATSRQEDRQKLLHVSLLADNSANALKAY